MDTKFYECGTLLLHQDMAADEDDDFISFSAVMSLEVRHILVEKHSIAKDILQKIQRRETTFNDAAREYYINKAGKARPLGWKAWGTLDSGFWNAAVIIPEGKYSREPCKTQYGYHLIKVQGRKWKMLNSAPGLTEPILCFLGSWDCEVPQTMLCCPAHGILVLRDVQARRLHYNTVSSGHKA